MQARAGMGNQIHSDTAGNHGRHLPQGADSRQEENKFFHVDSFSIITGSLLFKAVNICLIWCKQRISNSGQSRYWTFENSNSAAESAYPKV